MGSGKWGVGVTRGHAHEGVANVWGPRWKARDHERWVSASRALTAAWLFYQHSHVCDEDFARAARAGFGSRNGWCWVVLQWRLRRVWGQRQRVGSAGAGHRHTCGPAYMYVIHMLVRSYAFSGRVVDSWSAGYSPDMASAGRLRASTVHIRHECCCVAWRCTFPQADTLA